MKAIKFSLIFLLISFSLPSTTLADIEKEVKAAVSVGAEVPSKVCPQYSSVSMNTKEVLADNSQKITITVKLRDCSNVAMPGIETEVTTERGGIDKLKVLDDRGGVLETGTGLGLKGKTDINGFVFFQLFSQVPGKTVVNTKVDTLLNLDSITLSFKALPLPKYVSVSVEVPKFINKSGKITVFKPGQESVASDDLVDLGVNVVVPFWLVAIQFGLMLLTPLLFILVLALMLRVRRIQKKELAKIEETQELVKKEEQEIENIERNNQGPTPVL